VRVNKDSVIHENDFEFLEAIEYFIVFDTQKNRSELKNPLHKMRKNRQCVFTHTRPDR